MTTTLKTIGVLGTGDVGKTLAAGFQKLGHEVMLGSREGKAVEGWTGKTGSFAQTAQFGDILVLCVKGAVTQGVLKMCGPALNGKTVIDATNPIADAPPENGVLKFFTDANESLMERLQKEAPDAHFVKAFNSVGYLFMVNPKFGAKPTMFICGDNEGAKKEVSHILDQFGWETADMGFATSARAVEPLCMLWCIPGFSKNQWSHAFKLLTASK